MVSAVRLSLTVAALTVFAAPASGGVPGIAKVTSPSAGALVPALYRNCTALNRKYPHGLGKLRARDRTSGTPVTTFKRSTRLYNIAMSYNKGLDRDKDGIACEKR
jgi:hypothetical protein